MLIKPTFFWNRMARGYARKPVEYPQAYQRKLEMTASYLTPADRVFEFGCGTGSTALVHAPRVNSVDAIDFSSEMIAIAREKAHEQNVTNVNFNAIAFEDWTPPTGENRYDAVLGMSILHLVDDLDATLTRVYNTLKPGGYFFSSTVCIGEMRGWLRIVLPPLGAIGILPKILPLTVDGLRERITAHGFAVEELWRPREVGTVFIVTRKPE